MSIAFLCLLLLSLSMELKLNPKDVALVVCNLRLIWKQDSIASRKRHVIVTATLPQIKRHTNILLQLMAWSSFRIIHRPIANDLLPNDPCGPRSSHAQLICKRMQHVSINQRYLVELIDLFVFAYDLTPPHLYFIFASSPSPIDHPDRCFIQHHNVSLDFRNITQKYIILH